jgi:serine phosphatase RsbU (regulator of sigma subunit)
MQRAIAGTGAGGPARDEGHSPFYLQIVPAGGLAYQHEVPHGEMTIGRSRESGLQLADDSLSRRHARMRLEEGGVVFEDLGSRNGSFVNDAPITAPVRLQPGDRVLLGSTELFLRRRGPVRLSTDAGAPGGGGGIADASAVFDVTYLSGSTRSRQLFPDLAEENRALELLTRAGTLLIAHRPLAETLDVLLDLSLEAFGAERAAVVLLRDADGEPELAAARSPGGTIQLQVSRTVARAVVQGRKAVAITDVEADSRLALADSVRIQGVRSLMCAPLWDGTTVRGLLYVDRKLGHGDYSETDLKVLSMLANVTAVKIENAHLVAEAMAKERLEEELAVAKRIQERLMPSSPPAIDGIDLHGTFRACSEVGGDFFDFVPLPDGRWGVIIADVCGKGVGGALLAASLQAALRGGKNQPATPVERMRWLNDFVHEHSTVDKYITAAYVEIDPATGRLVSSSAGHPHPLILRADGSVQRLRAGGLPLGLFAESTYESEEAKLEPGERLVLYTDGIPEASLEGSRDLVFGNERIAAAARGAAGGAKATCAAVLATLDDFLRETSLRDDATIVAVVRR